MRERRAASDRGEPLPEATHDRHLDGCRQKGHGMPLKDWRGVHADPGDLSLLSLMVAAPRRLTDDAPV